MTPFTSPPRRRARLAALLLAPALAMGVGAGPALAATTPSDPDPVRATVLPPLDLLVGLFAPLPLRPVAPPPAATDCPDGADACVDAVIARMRARLGVLSASCSHRAVFSLAYLRVTENVRDAVRSGYFADRVWLNRVDTVFARMYDDTLASWESGDPARRATVPTAWRIALQAEDDRAMSGLGNFLLAMNAHINTDFPRVLAAVGLTGPDGSHKRDHDRYNQRLDSLYAPVFAEEAARFDPTFDDIDLGTLEETAAGVVMRGWREMVWRHAEALTLAPTPAARRLVEAEIDAYAALQARLVRAFFVAAPARRDAWCAVHGTGG